MVKNLFKDTAVVNAAKTVLAESGGIRHFLRQPHTQEPAVSDIDLDFLNQAAFRRDTEEIARQHHFNQADRVDGGPAVISAVEVGHGIADKFKVDSGVDFADQMVLGDEFARVMVSNWYCCGEGSLSMAVSPFFVLTLLDQSLKGLC